MNSWMFGCSAQYENTNNEFLRYVGRGKIGVAYDVCVHNGFAYVTNNQGVVIFDVSEPEDMREVGKIDIGGASFGIDVKEKTIYITGGKNLFTADITKPSNPKILGSINLSGNLSQVRVEGEYAYVANRQSGLQVLNVSDPKNLTIIGGFHNGGAGEAIEIMKNVAFLADSRDGLEVIDVSKPAEPQLVNTVSEAAGAWDIAIDRTEKFTDLYIGCHGNGLCIVRQVGDEQFKLIGQFNDGGEAQGVYVMDRMLFVADNFEFEILDIQDPGNPRKLAEIKKLNGLHEVFVDGNYIYLADGLKGLVILEYKRKSSLSTPKNFERK
jgi:hypothetical protein